MLQNNLIGIIGIVIALLGVGIAIFQDDLRPSPAPVASQVKDQVVAKSAEIFGVKVEAKQPRDWVRLLQFGLGFIGIILGAVSWVRKENHRVSSTAVALGAIAVAWEYVLIGIGIAVLILILGSFS